MSEPTPETTPQQVILSPEQQAPQEKFFKKIFGFATDIYVEMGLVETDDEEGKKELEKPKPIKEFKSEFN